MVLGRLWRGKTHPKHRWHYPMAWVIDWRQKRNQTEYQYSSPQLLDSWEVFTAESHFCRMSCLHDEMWSQTETRKKACFRSPLASVSWEQWENNTGCWRGALGTSSHSNRYLLWTEALSPTHLLSPSIAWVKSELSHSRVMRTICTFFPALLARKVETLAWGDG